MYHQRRFMKIISTNLLFTLFMIFVALRKGTLWYLKLLNNCFEPKFSPWNLILAFFKPLTTSTPTHFFNQEALCLPLINNHHSPQNKWLTQHHLCRYSWHTSLHNIDLSLRIAYVFLKHLVYQWNHPFILKTYSKNSGGKKVWQIRTVGNLVEKTLAT